MQSEQILLFFRSSFGCSQITISPFLEYFVLLKLDSWKDKTMVGHVLIFQLGLIHALKSDDRYAIVLILKVLL